jgi:Uma2 family endonuclease
MAFSLPQPLAIEDYLEGEQSSFERHEYLAGHVYAMTGGSQNHNRVTVNLTLLMGPYLRGSGCQLFASEMKVFIADLETFYYPDLAVTCQAETASDYYIEHPCLIIEVLSPSTERQDRAEKRFNYRQLASLQEFVLVDPRTPWVQIDQRQSPSWETEQLTEPGTLRLQSLGLDLPLAEIYEGVSYEFSLGMQ